MSPQVPQNPNEERLAANWLAAASAWGDGTDIADLERAADAAAGVERDTARVSFLGAAEEPAKPAREPLSLRDRARLQNNLARDANRHIMVGGRRRPVLHMSVRDLESFRHFTKPLEEILYYLLNEQVDFSLYAIEFREIHAHLLKNEVVQAAALVLGAKPGKLKRTSTPFELLNVVVEQWMHNLEIAALRERFPYPPPDEEEDQFTDEQLGTTGDPNGDNPTAFVEGLCEKYGWFYTDVLKMTVPQIYLLSCQAAWKAYRLKREMDLREKQREKNGGGTKGAGNIRRRGIDEVYFDGKWQKVQKMDRATYASYMNYCLSKPYEGVSG